MIVSWEHMKKEGRTVCDLQGDRVVEVSMKSVGIHGIRKKRRAQKRPEDKL